jgi:thiamine-phosphate pyrophosphorylase
MLAPKFIAITDTTVVPARDMLARARELCAACRPQSIMIQLRDRELGVRERLQLGERLAHVAHDFDQTLCVNDRLDLAMLLGAHALHLGEGSVRARDIRGRVGDRFWLTRASHEPSAIGDREADALILSPICAARKGASALGIGAIEAVRKRVSMPIYALGGVSASNAADCVRAGAIGVAAIGAWLASDSIESLITALGIVRST